MISLQLRHAIRLLARRPGFLAVAVLALALGIAATTTMVAAIDAVIFAAYRGLPDADRLVQVWDRYPDTDPGREVQVSVPNFDDYAAGQTSFERLAALQPTPLYLGGERARVALAGLHASADLFPLLGIEPLLGRRFSAEHDRVGVANVALISHGLWQSRFGGEADAVGRVVQLAAFKAGQGGWTTEPYEIIGVLPADFQLPPLRVSHDFTRLETPDVVLPLGLWTWGRGERGMYAFRVLGRLRPDVTVGQAAEQLQAIAAGIAEENPDTNAGYSVSVTPVLELVRTVHGRRMTILLAAAALLLLVACANVAGLLLARALARRREFAIRAAIGAGRSRLFGQLITESMVLAALGGVGGVMLAYALTGLLGRFVPPDIQGLDGLRIDVRILAFAVVAAGTTSLLFGLLPGLRASGERGDGILRQSTHGRGGTRHRGFRLLVAGQIALAFLLLAAAGALGLSLRNLLSADLGIDPEGVVLLQPAMPPRPLSSHGGSDAQLALADRIGERLRAVPGVEAVATVGAAPLEGREPRADFTLADRPPPPPEERESADWIFASPGYFEAMGIPVREGRGLIESDLRRGREQREPGEPLPEEAAVINETMAERYWPGESALGKILYYGVQDPKTVTTGSYETGEWDRRYPVPSPLRVVGVVATANMLGLAEEDRLQFYTVSQRVSGRWWVVRVRTDAAAMAPGLASVLEGIDPEVQVSRVETMDDRIRGAAAVARFQLFLVGAFGVVAGALATVGLFAVVAFAVRQRTRELGVRLALGATPGRVRALVMRYGLTLAFAGLGVGLVLVLAGGRVIRSLLYDVEPTQPRVLIVAALVLGIAALAAALAPATRAARLDPVHVLTEE